MEQEKIELVLMRLEAEADKTEADWLSQVIEDAAIEITELVKGRDVKICELGNEIVRLSKELASKEAQLAEMQEPVERLLRYWQESKEGPGVFADRWEQAFLDLSQALSAAPEVLWAGEGTVEYDEITELYDIDTEDVYVTLSEYTPIGLKDGQQIKVFVVRKRDDEEPKP